MRKLILIFMVAMYGCQELPKKESKQKTPESSVTKYNSEGEVVK